MRWTITKKEHSIIFHHLHLFQSRTLDALSSSTPFHPQSHIHNILPSPAQPSLLTPHRIPSTRVVLRPARQWRRHLGLKANASLEDQGQVLTSPSAPPTSLPPSFTKPSIPPAKTKWYESSNGSLPLHNKIVVDLIAGGVLAAVGNPADVTMVRMQADGCLPPAQFRNYKSVTDAIRRKASQEGVGSLPFHSKIIAGLIA